MQCDWIPKAQERLLSLRSGGPGWSYRPGCAPSIEPTALASLGLLSAGSRSSGAHAGAAWLARLQQPDGALGVSTELTHPCWPTSHGLLLWSALGGFESNRQRAAAWLLGQRGKTVTRPADRAIGHDPTLTGWSWVPDTHSWLEPTALAVLALRRHGLANHPRILEGLRLIRDRAVPSGGWNYGNRAVFGRALRPQPAPTGLALLSLSGEALDAETRAVAARACRYLLTTLPTIRAASSLGWGLLGLSAWNLFPADASDWMAESAAQNLSRPDAAPRLAILLLAAGDQSYRVLSS